MTEFVKAARKLGKKRMLDKYRRFKKRLKRVSLDENKRNKAELWRVELRKAHGVKK